MSNYADYFNKLSQRSDTDNDIDFGTIYDHRSNMVKRRYKYTHPNQLRTMTTHHSKKISHNKQNDLLGALEMLVNKPPQPLPISEYLKQVPAQKKKPFIIEETENLNKKPKPKDDGGLSDREKTMDKQLRDMEKEGVAKVHIDKSHTKTTPTLYEGKTKEQIGNMSPTEYMNWNKEQATKYAKMGKKWKPPVPMGYKPNEKPPAPQPVKPTPQPVKPTPQPPKKPIQLPTIHRQFQDGRGGIVAPDGKRYSGNIVVGPDGKVVAQEDIKYDLGGGVIMDKAPQNNSQNFMNAINYPKSQEVNTNVGDKPIKATF